jgi:hypothetical protein
VFKIGFDLTIVIFIEKVKRFLYNLKVMQVIPFKISIIALPEHSVTQIALVANGSENATCKWQIAVSGDPNHQIVQETGEVAICEVRLMSTAGSVRVTYLKSEKLYRKEYSLTGDKNSKVPMVVKGEITVNIPLSLDFSNDVKITGILSCRVERKALKSLNTDEIEEDVLPGNFSESDDSDMDPRLRKMREALTMQNPEEYAATVLEVREPVVVDMPQDSKPKVTPERSMPKVIPQQSVPKVSKKPIAPKVSRPKNDSSPKKKVPQSPQKNEPDQNHVPVELPSKAPVYRKIEPMHIALITMAFVVLTCMFTMLYMMNRMISLETQLLQQNQNKEKLE